MTNQEKIIQARDKIKRDRALRVEFKAKEKEAEKQNESSFKFPDERKEPLYGKVPQTLLRDSKIEPGPKVIWGLAHTYAPIKDLKGIPTAFVSAQTMAWDLGVSVWTIWRWIKILKNNGWAKIKKRGQGKSNIIDLYSRKRG